MTFRDTLTPRLKSQYDLDIDSKLETKKSYILTGTPGTGKTTQALQLVKTQLEKHPVKRWDGQNIDSITLAPDKEDEDYMFITAYDLIQACRSIYSQDDRIRWRAADVWTQAKNVLCLIIDDLGKEKTTEYSLSRFYELIDYRYNQLTQTIITTNLTQSQIADYYGDATASRIFGMGEVIEVQGKDKRITIGF